MRVALVTGGGSGIGRSAALELNKIDFFPPKTQILQNFSVSHSDDLNVIKENLVSQLYSPVRWSEIMDFFVH